jgi:hypothetical protein
MDPLQQLSSYIPKESVFVRRTFDRVTGSETEWRKLAAIEAIFWSAIGAAGYLLVDAVSMPVISLVLRAATFNFYQFPSDMRSGLNDALSSLYFSAAMTKAVWLNFRDPKLNPLEFVVPAEIKNSAWLQSNVSEGFVDALMTEFEVDGPFHRLYIDSSRLQTKPPEGASLEYASLREVKIGDFTLLQFDVESSEKKIDIINLLTLLEDNSNLVLINTPGNKAYLLEKNNPLIQSLTRDGHIAVFTPPTVMRKPVVEEEKIDLCKATIFSSSSMQTQPVAEPAPVFQNLVHSLILMAELNGSKLIPPKSAQAEPEAEPVSWTTSLGGVCKTYFTGDDHPIKAKKYEIIAMQTLEYFQQEEMQQQLAHIRKQNFTNLKDKCVQVEFVAMNPGKYSDHRVQYTAFTLELQKEAAAVSGKDDACKAWMGKVCYHRFAEVKLFNYCKDLVENASGYLSNDLTLGSFWAALEGRRARVDTICTSAAGLTPAVRGLQKAKGHFNVYFNPLAGSNVPYIYAYMQMTNSQPIKILRHGVPVTQSPGLASLLSWTRIVNPTPPIITADYISFIEEAESKGENILHFIFENGTAKALGDESGRVKARLELGNKHKNFFPVALRMDGDFFKGTSYTELRQDDFKRELCKNFLTETAGFCFPEKIRKIMRDKGKTVTEYVETIINTVEAIYFSDQSISFSKERFQAFILLTYAHFSHALCRDLDISILEALCKDDKDRGGAFKAILTLDFLYRSNQLTPEKLDELMVNIMAAPLIITKDAMLGDRAILIKHVLDVMQQAPKYNDLEDKYKVRGEFTVAKEPYEVVL